MTSEQWTGRDVKGGGRGLISGSPVIFFEREKPWKLSRMAGVLAGNLTEHLPNSLHARGNTASANVLGFLFSPLQPLFSSNP